MPLTTTATNGSVGPLNQALLTYEGQTSGKSEFPVSYSLLGTRVKDTISPLLRSLGELPFDRIEASVGRTMPRLPSTLDPMLHIPGDGKALGLLCALDGEGILALLNQRSDDTARQDSEQSPKVFTLGDTVTGPENFLRIHLCTGPTMVDALGRNVLNTFFREGYYVTGKISHAGNTEELARVDSLVKSKFIKRNRQGGIVDARLRLEQQQRKKTVDDITFFLTQEMTEARRLRGGIFCKIPGVSPDLDRALALMTYSSEHRGQPITVWQNNGRNEQHLDKSKGLSVIDQLRNIMNEVSEGHPDIIHTFSASFL